MKEEDQLWEWGDKKKSPLPLVFKEFLFLDIHINFFEFKIGTPDFL
jgi:hypothetical protein